MSVQEFGRDHYFAPDGADAKAAVATKGRLSSGEWFTYRSVGKSF